MTLLLGLIAATSVAVHVAETDRVSIDNVVLIADSVAAAIEAHADVRASIDDADWSACQRPDGCTEDVRARTGSTDVVVLRILGGTKRIRVAAHRDGTERRAQVDLRKGDRPAWADAMTEIAARLFDPKVVIETATTSVLRPPPRSGSIAPWIVLGGSVVVAATAAGFGLAARSDARTLRTMALPAAAHDDLQGRLSSRATFANALFGIAAAGLVASVVWWFLDTAD